MTITTDPSLMTDDLEAQAISCLAFLSNTWPEVGPLLLERFEFLFSEDTQCEIATLIVKIS